MSNLIFTLTSLAWAFFLLAGVLGLKSKQCFGDLLALLGVLLLLAAACCSWWIRQRLPVYGQFEANLHMALVLTVCAEGLLRKQVFAAVSRSWARLLAALLLAVALFGVGEPVPEYYMYHFLPVQLFFSLRLSAAGVLILACILYTLFWIKLLRARDNKVQASLRQGMLFLILGSILFLCSELAGTVWLALGWGDTWHWSQNFFKSAAMFLLLMLPLHLPQWLKKNTRRAGIGSLCTLLVVLGLVWP